LLRGEELPNDRAELRSKIVAVEPPLEEDVGGWDPVMLDEISKSVRFRSETFSLDHQTYRVLKSLRGMRNSTGQKENLKRTLWH
jgi:hypothetical protein